MKKWKIILCASILVTSLIVPTTSYASNNQSTIDQKYFQTVINQLFTFFQGNNQSVVYRTEVYVSGKGKGNFSNPKPFYIGNEKYTSKDMEKYQNRHRDENDHNRYNHHDDDCYDHPKEPIDSREIWRDWYCNDDWDWDWWWRRD